MLVDGFPKVTLRNDLHNWKAWLPMDLSDLGNITLLRAVEANAPVPILLSEFPNVTVSRE